MTLRLVIAGDSNRCAWNQRLHWRARWGRDQAWKANAGMMWRAAGSPWVGERVRISFVIRRGRRVDPQNAMQSSALKAIVDGLKGGAFPDDDAKHLEMGEVRQEPGARYKLCPEVEVIVESMVKE